MNWCVIAIRFFCAALFSLLILGWPAIVLTNGYHKEHDKCAACVVNDTSLEQKVIDRVDLSVLLAWVPVVSLFVGFFVFMSAKTTYQRTSSFSRKQCCVVGCVTIPSFAVWMILIGINASVYSTEVCSGCDSMLEYVKATMWYCVMMCVLSVSIIVYCLNQHRGGGGEYGMFGGEV